MKKLLILLLLIPSLSWGADYEKGVTAYNQGDYATAIKEWTPLAKQGNSYAQYNLGIMYDKGDGVVQNDKTAVKWYTLAAEQGYTLAQYNLGVKYQEGVGVVQNYKTAAKWFTLAAEQGHTSAQYNLGVMYGNGIGVLQDNIYAHMWFNIAASSGDSKAADNRTIVEKNMTTADISKAQELARQCVNKNYKDC